MTSRFRPATAGLWMALAVVVVCARTRDALAEAEVPPGPAATAPAHPPEGAPAAAQDADGPGVDQALDALVAEALARNPDALVAAEAVAAASARPAQARSLADPMVSVQYTNDAWRPTLGEREMTTLGFMVSQTLPSPGKRALRGALAAQDAVQAQQQAARVRLGLGAAVKRAYWGLALARETLSLLEEQAAVWREAEGVARARYTVGQGAQQDVLRAQLEITRFEQRRVEQQAALEVRRVELNRLLGRPAETDAPPSVRLRLRERPPELAALVAQAEARSPELRAAEAAGEREQIAVRLARKEFQPDLTVQGGYMNRGALDPMWQAGVGVNLPVFRGRRRAAVAEAEARGRAVGRQVEATRAQLRYRTQERLTQLQAAASLAKLYVEGLLPQARLSYEAAIAGYQAGRLPFLAVLEALSGLFAERAGHLSLLAAHERILISLEEASLEATSELPSAGGSAMGTAAFAGSMPPAGGMGAGAAPAAAPAAPGMSMGQ